MIKNWWNDNFGPQSWHVASLEIVCPKVEGEDAFWGRSGPLKRDVLPKHVQGGGATIWGRFQKFARLAR